MLQRRTLHRPKAAADGLAVARGWRWRTMTEYDALCATAVASGLVELSFSPVVLTHGSHRLTVLVADDALALGTSTRVRLAPTQAGGQRLLDLIGGLHGAPCTFPTPRIIDAVFAASGVRLGSHPQSPYPGVLAASAWLKAQAAMEQDRAGRQGLIGNVGKELCTAPLLASRGLPSYREPRGKGSHFCEGSGPKTMFYGWYTTRAASGPPRPTVGPFLPHDPSLLPADTLILQCESTCHRDPFTDYAQALRPVLLECDLDGSSTSLADIYRSAELSPLVYRGGGVIPSRYPAA